MTHNYSSARRDFLKKGLGLGLFATAGYGLSALSFTDKTQAAGGDETFEITRSEQEWREILTPQQFEILRKEGTERPGSSPLNDEKRPGIFHCAGCDLAVYDAKTKYESGTGWPSFYEALPDAVGTREDNSFFMKRTEVHCSRCGGHFGHIFDDGPQPTGLRHCINGLSLSFKPETA
jgi:peptide-methionine (R)-S-oxide reductase